MRNLFMVNLVVPVYLKNADHVETTLSLFLFFAQRYAQALFCLAKAPSHVNCLGVKASQQQGDRPIFSRVSTMTTVRISTSWISMSL